MIWYMELEYSSLPKKVFDFLGKNFIYYPDRGNPDGFFDDFRPDYSNTPVWKAKGPESKIYFYIFDKAHLSAFISQLVNYSSSKKG